VAQPYPIQPIALLNDNLLKPVPPRIRPDAMPLFPLKGGGQRSPPRNEGGELEMEGVRDGQQQQQQQQQGAQWLVMYAT
jgi:hypothetical protein